MQQQNSRPRFYVLCWEVFLFFILKHNRNNFYVYIWNITQYGKRIENKIKIWLFLYVFTPCIHDFINLYINLFRFCIFILFCIFFINRQHRENLYNVFVFNFYCMLYVIHKYIYIYMFCSIPFFHTTTIPCVYVKHIMLRKNNIIFSCSIYIYVAHSL